MAISLIGDTGFVGGNLLRQVPVDAAYNSGTIDAIVGRCFDLLIIAGAPGAKWRANQDPDADDAAIARLTAALMQVTARRAVLISTVDVYPNAVGVSEATAVVPTDASPYGRHRRQLEDVVTTRFDAVVIRLPGLFGPGLRKNVIFDLLNRRGIEQINPDSTYQWYPIDRLWIDIRLALAKRLQLVNLVTEPLRVDELARDAFGLELAAAGASAPATYYDVRTEYDRLFGGRGGYLAAKTESVRRIAAFVKQARAQV